MTPTATAPACRAAAMSGGLSPTYATACSASSTADFSGPCTCVNTSSGARRTAARLGSTETGCLAVMMTARSPAAWTALIASAAPGSSEVRPGASRT